MAIVIMMQRSWFSTWLLAAGLSLAGLGCGDDSELIKKVVFEPSSNLETARVTLFFTKKVRSDLSGGFLLKDHGYLFLQPYQSGSKPFRVGFELRSTVVNDADIGRLEPTTVLPNGIPIGLPYSIVQVHSPQPIHAKFDLYGYVDVLHGAWLGVASIFNFIDRDNFPPDLSVSQVFMRDPQGRPGVTVHIFGPSLNPDRSIRRPGGIALFANVPQLIAYLGKESRVELSSPEPIRIHGPAAGAYRENPAKLLELGRKLVDGLNAE